jgi:hypothetical protein
VLRKGCWLSCYLVTKEKFDADKVACLVFRTRHNKIDALLRVDDGVSENAWGLRTFYEVQALLHERLLAVLPVDAG